MNPGSISKHPKTKVPSNEIRNRRHGTVPIPKAQEQVGSTVMSLLKELETARSRKRIDPYKMLSPGDTKDIIHKENTVILGSK